MNMENYYRTKDLSEASFLYASGKKLTKLEQDNSKFWFLFDDKPSCEQLVEAYWQKDAIVNAKEFADAIRSLKDIIFSRARKGD